MQRNLQLDSPRGSDASHSDGGSPPANPLLSGFVDALATCMASFCLPLPRKFLCLGMNLKNAMRVILTIQMAYGLILIVLHFLLFIPPMDEPTVEWFPAFNGLPLEMADLQFSLRIRGGKTPTYHEPMMRVGGSLNVPGIAVAICLGVLHFFGAAIVMYTITYHQPTENLKRFEKFYLIFTTMQVPYFCLCNLGKVSVLCPDIPQQAGRNPAPPREVSDIGSPEFPSQALHITSLFSQLSNHCSVLRVWFVEWTIMVSVLAGIGVWVCWSYVNARFQQDSLSANEFASRSSSEFATRRSSYEFATRRSSDEFARRSSDEFATRRSIA